MANQITRLAVLGSTGSIGAQTLDIVRRFPDRLSITALAAGCNLPLLAKQVGEFQPLFIHRQDKAGSFPPGDYQEIGLEEMAALPEADIIVIALPGMAGLRPVIAAAKAGKIIALANKESLVSAGEIVMAEAHKSGAQIHPVDSEHSAIWQCLAGEISPPEKLILTASGGPFRSYSRVELAQVTASEALRHPSWQMGRKVTIDSATLMNKGLEVIEAHYLFRMPYQQIEVVIHPQSLVHSMVAFADGTIKAQLGPADMRLPIQYALSYPARWDNEATPRLDFKQVSCLDFASPDETRFPCLRLAIEAGKKGGTYAAALCAADEIVVELFLESRIRFNDIPILVEDVLAKHQPISQPEIVDICRAAAWARQEVLHAVKREKLHC
jgi:1-deoxy-D-xylulose-5-phosphate reductoisomerase